MLDTNISKLSNSKFKSLKNKIQTNSAVVVVLGLGYVGLPTAKHYVDKGFSVVGLDISEDKVSQLKSGKSYIQDVSALELEGMLEKGFYPTTDVEILNEADIVVICVPTPIDHLKNPDLSYVENAGKMISRSSNGDLLVILESTTYPGTTERFIAKPLEEKKLIVGEDVFIAYSPERIDPGNQHFSLVNTPKVIGGMTSKCTDLAAEFIGETAHRVSDIKVAELSKVFENTFRWINIALVNEVAELAHSLDIDIWEVLDAADSKPYGFMRFNPGIGVGGHCIPVDPYYLTYIMKENGKTTRMINLAGEINDQRINHTVMRILEWFNEKRLVLSDSKVAVLGAAYKKNIGDLRESPVLNLVETLEKYTEEIVVIDPYVESSLSVALGNQQTTYTSKVDYQAFSEYDLVIIATPHDCIDYQRVLLNSNLIFDTQNIFMAEVYAESSKVRKL
ncbi:UDP-N-acetyl-D-glucosamine dehydrogenase [Exiguobacterium sp. 8H]|uniref:nucleotide sugar dehydrogenase n=1 Tax=unclassified Exiguobacterium TaxID=2644629 RepID=UPI0012EFCDCC|nr:MULTISPECIES: nucleotide sugar dehydrogenase [unclassified Exiguobacterium]VXB83813.1 UDP-N-acetyl-D-glucosamine dehydrogenase [Exiguobacterium sp. 8H]VXB97013.1 UDP-N-acetyl-D-glucosamine dehydrogenase [Exiguobacterium sp. 8A]